MTSLMSTMAQSTSGAQSPNATIAGLVFPEKLMSEAQRLYARFKHTHLEQGDINETNQLLDTLAFINYAWDTNAAVGAAAFKAFDAQIVKQNIHIVLNNLDFSNEQMQEALQLYYKAQHSYTTASKTYAQFTEMPALFAAAGFRKLAVFAGQGGMDNYMDETRSVFAVYRPLVEAFVREMAAFIKQEAQAPLFKPLYQHGLDVMHWIEFPEDMPEQSYMISVPVCLPIVGMTQLMQVMVLYKTLGISPAELADKFDLLTGHSQGIVSAVVLSMATDEESFYHIAKKAIGLWILTGTFPQLDYPLVDPLPLEANKNAVPTPMVAVLKLTRTQLQAQIDQFNEHQSSETKVHLSLINGPRMHVVSGVTSSLRQFVNTLTTNFDTAGSDQTRIPYSQRKPRVAIKYLSINGPYHSVLLEHACSGACKYAEEHGWLLDGHGLRRPVKTYEDGSNIQGIADLSQYLLRCMMVFRVDWPAAVDLPGLTHVVDFGPGGISGIGSIVQRIYEGRGIAVICAGAFVSYGSSMRAKADLYRLDVKDSLPPKSWAKEFAPQLVRCAGDNSLHIDTPMSRLLGKPPVMVAGMTPSTISAEFVSAVMRAGYHIELSGGGHFSEPMLRDKVDKILKLVDPGSSVTVNSIYVNPFLWNIQYPALQAMRREGIPMDGLCIGAGVPSFEVCNDIIAHIREVGFRHIGLKPGSVSTIRLVIKIAQANPDFPIMLQWTGGRGGGHHSFEDFHQPILETYGAIRTCKNIVLVAGSGFGGVDDTLPYLTGDWSLRFDCAPMPFDGILFGSRVMVAKEGGASDAVKETIVAAAGIDDSEWEQTYQGPAGGIVTVLSELGEPIHKIATRGVMFWKELDDTVFSLPRDKRLPALLAKKQYIIDRLNADFQKPWFGRKANGKTADLEEMTYAEVAQRLLQVLYISHQSRWIDVTMRNLVGDYLLRLEERFTTSQGPAILQSFAQLQDEPYKQVQAIIDAYPDCQTQLLASEDVRFFINLCMRPGQKPVPFIPLMDKDFHIWFKKDSLWQAEDVDAVADQDVGRVCILQGPVAVRYATKANEPVKDILDNIYQGQIAALLAKYYHGDQSEVPEVEYLGNEQTLVKMPPFIQTEGDKFILPSRKSQLPEPTQWLETLAGNCGWLRALLLTPIVVQNRRYASNVVQRVLRPRVSQQVQRTAQGLQITDASGAVAVDISIQDQLIQFNMHSAPRGQVCTLNLQFKYQPTMAFAPIHEVMEGRNERIKKFYAQVWFEKSEEAIDIISHPAECLEYHGSEMVASSEDVEQFCRAIGNLSSFYISDCSNKSRVAPMDYAMRVFWPALCKCLMSPVCDGDLTKLVHVSNSFHMCPNAQAVVVGERLSSCAKITEIVDGSAGRSVRVQGHVLRGPEQVVAINTSFLFRGHSPDYSCNFKHVDEPVMELEIADWTMLAILRGKEWFVMHPQMSNALCVGAILRFQLHSQYRYKSEKVFAHVATFGQVQARSKVLNSWTVIADVDFEGTNMFDSLVLRYLRANAREVDTERLLPGDGRVITGSAQDYTARAPTSNAHYSSASGDHNPIHTSAYFADLVQLPDTITHGMWTSAAARRTLERVAANGDPARIYEYQAQFVDMIVPGTQLETRLHHTGWAGGRMTVHIEAFADSVRVLEGRAKVAMPRTALAFTGQGAQHLNMGMALYKESATARRIWDAADIFMRDTYGISLLHIVQSNPKQLKVHFVGERGEQIRRVYQNMQYEYRVDGQLVSQPLFPDITDSTVSYTFSAPNGLLFATQFTQPAMLVNAVAEFAHLHDLNVVPADAVLAGHSLGEFAVLCAGVQLFEPEAAVEIGFGRGLLMQQSVRRDSYGRSTYAMLAVNPTHVASWFTFKDLTVSISAILQYCNYNGLLETVNHNVRDKQYVVAGDRLLLEALSFMLSLLSQHTEMPRTKIAQMVHKAIEHALKRQSQDQFFELERTQATTPIPGIDVPFHSSLLREGTWSFRKLLQRIIKPEQVSVDQLRRYIPNLTARPFAVDKEYIQNVFELTGSTILEELLQTLTTAQMQDQKKVAHTLLIEVLSYQFASPVRWIETQDVMLHELGIKRFIEIGPANVLSTMFKRTLHQLGFAEQSPSLSVLCSASDMDAITLQSIAENDNANRPDTTAAEVPASIKSDTQPSKVTETHQPSAPVQQPPSALVEIADAPISSLEAIRALIAYKLKLELDAVPASVAIKDLVGGKSTLQNEIVGDLQKEFGGDLPDKPEEMPLSELSQNLTSSSDSLGKVSATLISRMLASKMPGGVTRSSIGEHLQSKYGLPPMRQQALLLVALAMEPASRLDSETSAYEWLHKVAQKYAQLAGISYAQAQAAGNAGAEIRQVAVINSDEFNQAQKAQSQLAVRTMHVLAAYLNVNIDTQPPMPPSSVDSSVWLDEYGQEFCDRITPMFAPLKARHYDSFWNWARQDLIKLYYDILDGRVTKIDLSMSSHCLRLMNRVTPSMIAMLNHIVKCAEQGVTPAHALARKYGAILVKQCELGIHSMPSYQFTQQLRAPRVRINSTGEVEYYEVDRHGESMVRDYVQNVCSEAGQLHMGSTSSSLDVMLKKLGLISLPAPCTIQHILPPMVHLRSRDQSDPTKWSYDAEKSLAFADILMDICSNGLALSGRRALVTGCGRGSIGAEVIKGLLEAGVQVIATTSSYSAVSTQYFQSLYQTHGSRGSSLTLLPFNQASRQDIESLVDYIYSTKGLDWDLDYVLPFAAIPELGHDITALDSWSELSHRTMLTNVMRLIGAIAVQKQKRRLDMHPTLAVLPLSPNHGAFGYDGHYSESKLGLETMLSRWHAEPTWAKYVSVAGAVIGWTRGTGLMSGNNIVAEYVESTGVRTFSAGEMAFNILGLLHPQAYAMAARSPVWADLAGRFQFYPDLTKSIVNLHQALGKLKDVLKKAAAEAKADFVLAADDNIERVYGLNTISKRANHKYKFPKVKSYEELQHLRQLEGMVNLDRVVVVTGYGEVGPYGHAETRWEMEADGEFSLEGCIELAWIMGLIKHHNGKHKTTNKPYVGWVDAQTGEPVADRLVKKKYEKYILEHTGIRLIEPDMVDGYDPLQKTILRELQIEHDMEPFEATEEEALQFKQRNGDKVRIWEQNSTWYVRLLRGATLLVPKALRFDRLVAAQLPTGWNPERFGIPKNIADQVDPVTCYALVATTEALVRSGITDPYELYRYVHMSEVGSSTGTALGGLRSMKRVFNERFLDKDQPPDVYQETFLSTPPAWINMLLMSASGPIKTTIGACATGIASIDVAVDTIQAGKAKIMLAGGTDALCEESSYEFAQMNATSNTLSEFEQGRTPREMSRPCTTTRNGFMESEGAGIVTLMSAATAIKIGAPIYGIVAMAGTATDKEGRSVPAPGKGVLTSARETGNTSPLLDIEYRRRQLQLRQLQIREWVENERKYLDSSEQLKFIDAEGERQHREALDTWGNDFWKRNPDISPLRGCLAVWGLTVDDIGVASFHGTSTKANDKNESEIVDKQMQHLGRTPGNTIFSVCQKYLTGHPKGPASIWMLNGALQMLRSGIVPGNRNADNIAAELEKCQYIMYPSQSIRTPGLKAGLVKSFGFGQVGAECLLVHPDYLFAVLDKQQLEAYSRLNSQREAQAYRYWHNVLVDAHPFVQVKSSPPYTAEQEEQMYLDPLARP